MHKIYNTFWFIVIIECFAIGAIVLVFFLRQQHIFQINPLSKTSIQRKQDSQFQYYYELPQHTVDYGQAAWLPHTATYRYNNDGFNERFDYELNKASDVYRIITLGDSFAFGMWVNTEDNFSEQLEDKLNATIICKRVSKFEVINLGAPGFDVKYTVRRYEDKGAPYNPDLIIWFMRGENIFMDMEQYRKREEFYKQESQLTGAAERYHADKSDQYAASTLSYKEYMDAYTKLTKEQQEQFIQPSRIAIREWANQNTAPLFIATMASEEDRYKAIVKSFINGRKQSWYFEVGAIDTFFPYDYHPNDQGHKKIADELLHYIVSQILTDCQEKKTL